MNFLSDSRRAGGSKVNEHLFEGLARIRMEKDLRENTKKKKEISTKGERKELDAETDAGRLVAKRRKKPRKRSLCPLLRGKASEGGLQDK